MTNYENTPSTSVKEEMSSKDEFTAVDQTTAPISMTAIERADRALLKFIQKYQLSLSVVEDPKFLEFIDIIQSGSLRSRPVDDDEA